MPHIIRMGGDEYAKIGVANSTGTKLVSVSGNVTNPGNFEVPLGISSRELIYGLAGGPPEGREVKLWFPGGSSSPVLTKDDLDLPYDFDSMAKAGSMLGSGAIIVVDDSNSVVDVAMKTAKFYRHESCGKCTPCREGTNWTVKMLERIEHGEATPMDLDIMAGVCTNIIGNCLCVLGDAMAMPIGSMIVKFRDEFEAYIEAARERNDAGHDRGGAARGADPGSRRLMPRPRQRMVTFSIDGREVSAPENIMLVDGAKYGDVEIPVFCYEPKLGAPVGACRMCLVEIEGIPKLQTGCSTPVKDGMVVHTQTERVRVAQEAVVEFLLINHPLDCPVCDKGGECPLQDISFGWGGGRSRFIEPKRHFAKPLALSPLIAIDRERCILCYRCVRFSQEISEDYQLDPPGARRALLRGHVRRPSLRRPVQRQHRRAVPGGRADLPALPLPRAPVGHRGLGLGVHDVPVAVQRAVHRARRARAARPRPRQPRGRRRLAVRQGPLRLPGGARRRAHHPADGARRRRAAARVVGARAERGGRRARPGARPRRRDRRRRDDQRGGLPAAAARARGAASPTTSTRARAGRCRASCTTRWARRACRPRWPTSSSPTPC